MRRRERRSNNQGHHGNRIANQRYRKLARRFFRKSRSAYRGDAFIRKNVIAVHRFNDQNKVERLDIYEQAKDSGERIKVAAKAATEVG
jgi:hypothetical protein